MELGVKTGMVRSKFNCIAGLDAFKQNFKKISSEMNATDVLKEWFVKRYLKEDFAKNVSQSDRDNWMRKYKKSFNESVRDSLVKGMGCSHHARRTTLYVTLLVYVEPFRARKIFL